jgi:hypothetical protein
MILDTTRHEDVQVTSTCVQVHTDAQNTMQQLRYIMLFLTLVGSAIVFRGPCFFGLLPNAREAVLPCQSCKRCDGTATQMCVLQQTRSREKKKTRTARQTWKEI